MEKSFNMFLSSTYVDIRFVQKESKEILQKIKATISSDIQMEIITHEPPEIYCSRNPYLLTLQKAILDYNW